MKKIAYLIEYYRYGGVIYKHYLSSSKKSDRTFCIVSLKSHILFLLQQGRLVIMKLEILLLILTKYFC